MEKSYQIKKFFFINAVSSLILISYFIDISQEIWVAVDTYIFRFLNGLVGQYHDFAYFVAMCDTKDFSRYLAVAMIIYSGIFIFERFDKKIISKNLTIIFTLGLIYIVCFAVAFQLESVARLSPSLVFTDFYNLRELFPYISSKVSSPHSFPSDHGVASGFFALSFWLYAKRLRFILPILFLFGTMPRMIAGAHWFTDIYVGSLFVIILGLTLMKCFPISAYIQMLITDPLLDKVCSFVNKKEKLGNNEVAKND